MLPPTPENLPHGYARCADGALCRMRHPDLPHAGFAHFRHRCADCEGHLHSLCGFEDASLTADGSMHNRYCRSCHAKKRSGDHSSGDGGGRDPPDQSRDVAVAECLAGDATSANTIPGEDQAGSPPNPPHPDPNCSQLEPANSSIASQSEGSAPCTAERHITDPYVSTQSCEEGDGYCPPRTLSVALEASPSPKHPELKARRITAMFAYHEDRRRAIRLTMERQREVERRRAEEDRIRTEEKNYPSKKFLLDDSNLPAARSEYGPLHLKGRVSNLKSDALTRVEACAIYWTIPSKEALLVIRPADAPSEQEYFIAICGARLLPLQTQTKLGNLRYGHVKRKYGIQPMGGDYRTETVATGDEGELRYRIAQGSPLFVGKLCSQDMINALRSGCVGQKIQTIKFGPGSKRNTTTSGDKPKKPKVNRQYVVLPQPFASRSLVNFDLTRKIIADPTNDGTLSLLGTTQEERTRMLTGLQCARDSLFSSPQGLEKTIKSLNEMDEKPSTKNPPPYFVFLNVALGGGKTFAPFGQFY